MSAIVLYLAAIGCIAGWWLSRQRLMSKPWLEVGIPVEAPHGGLSGMPPVKLGLWVFMAVVGALLREADLEAATRALRQAFGSGR